MVALKKQIDREKENQLTKMAEELEQIKRQTRNQAQQEKEKQELLLLKT
jgi:DNA topoisomerase IB